LNANGLEIKQRFQRGMAFIDLTNIFVTAAKKLHFYCEKMDSFTLKAPGNFSASFPHFHGSQFAKSRMRQPHKGKGAAK